MFMNGKYEKLLVDTFLLDVASNLLSRGVLCVNQIAVTAGRDHLLVTCPGQGNLRYYVGCS